MAGVIDGPKTIVFCYEAPAASCISALMTVSTSCATDVSSAEPKICITAVGKSIAKV